MIAEEYIKDYNVISNKAKELEERNNVEMKLFNTI